MKFMRILAMLLAMLLMGTMCYAEEPAEAPAAEEEYPVHEAFLLPEISLTYEDWLSSPDMRAMFAVMLQLEMAVYEDEYQVSYMLETYGIPTIFISEVSGELNGNGITLYLFFTDAETGDSVLVTTTYLTAEGFFNGFIMDMTGDPTMIMDALSTVEGQEIVYHPVTFEEYYAALMTVDSIVNGEE